MFIESRDQSRAFFAAVHQKMNTGVVLEPLESLVAQVITAHPEYHALIERAGEADPGAAAGEAFFHMGLHIALAEQLQTDRPPGIRTAYQRIAMQHGGDTHAAEHRVMSCLAEVLWQASERGTPPDEQRYLDDLRRIA